MQCVCGLRLKNHIIFHILYIIVASLCSAFLKRVDFTKLIVLRSEVCFDWPAIQCIVIGEYRKRVTEMLRPLPYCDVVSWRDDTKTIKPIIN